MKRDVHWAIWFRIAPGALLLPGSIFFAKGRRYLPRIDSEAQFSYLHSAQKESSMAAVSKNSRTSSATQRFFCPCGGEIKMKTLFENGKVKNLAECEKCKRTERRPRDFV
jgi:hypothetical protein